MKLVKTQFSYAIMTENNNLIRFHPSVSINAFIFFTEKIDAINVYNSFLKDEMTMSFIDSKSYNTTKYKIIHHFTDETFYDDFVEYLI